MNYTLDATNQRLGRLASKAATLLQGKHSTSYAPSRAGADRVKVTNAGRLTVGGAKSVQKIYYHHTGYMGHLRSLTFAQQFERSPEKVIREAVRKMLPANRLRRNRLARLKIEN